MQLTWLFSHCSASLLPAYSFGETDLFNQADNPDGSALRRFQETVKRLVGFSPAFFYGRGIFNYSFGFLPHRKPINTVCESWLRAAWIVFFISSQTQLQWTSREQRRLFHIVNFSQHCSSFFFFHPGQKRCPFSCYCWGGVFTFVPASPMQKILSFLLHILSFQWPQRGRWAGQGKILNYGHTCTTDAGAKTLRNLHGDQSWVLRFRVLLSAKNTKFSFQWDILLKWRSLPHQPRKKLTRFISSTLMNWRSCSKNTNYSLDLINLQNLNFYNTIVLSAHYFFFPQWSHRSWLQLFLSNFCCSHRFLNILSDASLSYACTLSFLPPWWPVFLLFSFVDSALFVFLKEVSEKK